MKRILKWIKEEVFRVLPAIIYFFIAFSLIELTFGRMLERAGIHAAAFLKTLIGAIVIGKVLMVVDHLPFMKAGSNKPLIYSTLWRAAIYSLACLIVRSLDHLINYMVEYKSLGSALEHAISQEIWLLFITIQVWYFLLFFIFVAAVEIIKRVGEREFRKMFFG